MLHKLWLRTRNAELARHGLILFVALGIANLSNYLFHVVISRLLGPEEYGALGALLTVFIIISVPAGALQTVVARRISVIRAAGDDPAAGQTLKSALRAAALFGAGATLVLAALAPLGSRFLHIDSAPTYLLAAYALPAVVAPVARGALQGRLLFGPLAAVVVVSTILRLALGVALVGTGAGVAGAVGASLASEVIGLAMALLPVRGLVHRAPSAGALPAGILGEARTTMLILGGFWAVASADSFLVRHYFPTDTAGFYAAAAVAAHTVLFLSGAIALVAFPRFAESEGRSVEARRILFQSLVVVGVLGFSAAGALALFSPLAMRILFGGQFAAGTALLGTLAFAMALLGLTGILVYFHLASKSKAAWSVMVALLAETGLVAAVHGSTLQVASVMLAVSAGLLLFNLIAAYASPREIEIVSGSGRELWDPASHDIDLSVVTPSYNPGSEFKRNLENLFRSLRQSGVRYEVIAVSDGSTDGSHDVVTEISYDGLRFIHYELNRGKGFALRTGLARARGRYVAFIDSDGDLDPSAIQSFLVLMNTYEPDLIVGSKRHPLSQVHYPPLRRFLSFVYSLLVRALFGIKVGDTQTGLKLARREVLARSLPRMLEKRFAFDLELLVVAKRLGYHRFFEAPVKLTYQFSSTISVKDALRILLDTLAIFYRRHILRYYDQEPMDEELVTPRPEEAPVQPAEVP